MHELALMESLVTAVVRKVPDEKVIVVRLDVGRLTAVLPGALRFCFDICTKGTRLEGAVLEIQEIPGRARCRRCEGELEIQASVSACPCGSLDLQVLSGRELRLRDVEVV